jgi:hypothetical protein
MPQKPTLEQLEKMLAEGKSEQEILTAFGQAPAPDPYAKLRSDVSQAGAGAVEEGTNIFRGMKKQAEDLDSAPWTTKIGQAVRTGTYGPLVDTVKGFLGLGASGVKNGIAAAQGDPRAGGRGLVDLGLLYAGMRGLRKGGMEIGMPEDLLGSFRLKTPPSKVPLGPTPPPTPPANVNLPVERFPSPMSQWLAESTAGDTGPLTHKMGVNPEFPFAKEEFTFKADPTKKAKKRR